MKPKFTLATRRRVAKIFRDAATLVAKHPHSYGCCFAISYSNPKSPPGDKEYNLAKEYFESLYAPRGFSGCYWWANPRSGLFGATDDSGARILALLLAADSLNPKYKS